MAEKYDEYLNSLPRLTKISRDELPDLVVNDSIFLKNSFTGNYEKLKDYDIYRIK